MKKNSKAGLLVVLLIVPALLFIFLVNFGQNKFALPFLLAHSVQNNSEILVLNDTIDEQIQVFLTQYSAKNSINKDTLYLQLPLEALNFPLNKIVILFYSETDSNPSENQKAEMLRINEKIKNKDDIVLFERYKGGSDSEFWINFSLFVKTEVSESYNSEGMFFLFDKNGFCRGLYNPSIKAEVDRLITEYQILQKF